MDYCKIFNQRKRRAWALLLSAICVAMTAWCAPKIPATISSRMPTQVLMGDTVNMEVEVVQDKGIRGHFRDLQGMTSDAWLPVCNDSVELRSPVSSDTVDLGSDRLQITFRIPVQSFDPGLYRLPPVAFVLGSDTLLSHPLALKVMPLDSITAETEIYGLAPVAKINAKWHDYIPDWMFYGWWIILLCVIVVVLGIWLYIWWKKNKPEQTVDTSKPSPYELAVWQLRQLKGKQLWQTGKDKEFYTSLTEILRGYLENRFGINAMEMTSAQILRNLGENPETADKKKYIQDILNVADFVKFAKMHPLADDNQSSFDYAERFVEETRPVEKPEENPDDDAKESGEEKKGGEA